MDLTTIAVYMIYRASILVCIGDLNAFKCFLNTLQKALLFVIATSIKQLFG